MKPITSRAFNEAVINSRTLAEKPDNDTLLQLYALFKQATEGDAPEEGDYGMFDFKEKFKHETWKQKKGMDSETAQQEYIALVNRLAGK
ncbi:acyl-CoA-binding protein [Taibaiella sp. KBW10]|uniref:acyl-CoA-binding protein n=1 Tax=Taibaiella sp. KBW10 TaxID=2153357 RepID=UPI000F5A79F8|nr:acyl-CoA-binding protein [Taibaiella sp. KBW10]RQO32584.1 acyl-CoA-binding protein [Taibaiella sp. KBW10]